MTHREALRQFLAGPAAEAWRELPFFADGSADRLAGELDRRAGTGVTILPAPDDVFRALMLTPLEAVRVVILGQDPYPTPGDAHGLAFSFRGAGRLPASLKRIFTELSADLGLAARTGGDLSAWARQGVLLLNTALSVEAGKAGSHLSLGWQALADQVIAAVSARSRPAVFILWGDRARARKPLIAPRHHIIETAHPSPLAARGDFMGSKPFSRANAFLASQGQRPIDWNAA